MTRYTIKACTRLDDETDTINFLDGVRDELYLPSRTVVADIVDQLFLHGGVIAAYDGDVMGGMLGYFHGEPARDFADPEIAFLYVAAIAEPYRLSRMFRQGLIFAIRHLARLGASEIRLQAEASNPYTNRLYARFARPLEESRSPRGIPVTTYGATLEAALAALTRRPTTVPEATPDGT